MIVPRHFALAAARHGRCLFALRPASASFTSYSMPSTTSRPSTTTAPRNDDVAETSITMPPRPSPSTSSSSSSSSSSQAVPKVHETRPPPGATSPAATPTSESTQESRQTTPAPPAAAKPSARPRSTLRRPRKAAMKLTPAAVEQLRALLDMPEPKLIKVGVRNRGCSGLAYHLEYVDKQGAFDELVEQDGVKVVVDSKALFSIIGSEMDWKEDKLNQRFVFKNPNIKEECGCGESFMV